MEPVELFSRIAADEDKEAALAERLMPHFNRERSDEPTEVEMLAATSKPNQHQRRLNDAQVQELVTGYLSGATVSQLARDWGIHRTTVMEHLRRTNTPTRPHRRKLTDKQVARAAQEYEQGDSFAALGQRYGVDAKTIGRELRCFGITIRAPGRGTLDRTVSYERKSQTPM